MSFVKFLTPVKIKTIDKNPFPSFISFYFCHYFGLAEEAPRCPAYGYQIMQVPLAEPLHDLDLIGSRLLVTGYRSTALEGTVNPRIPPPALAGGAWEGEILRRGATAH